MAFSDFFIGYTPVSLYSRCYLCSHSELVTQTTATLHKKLYWVNKKNISYKSWVAHQNYVDHKKYVLETNYVTLKKETHVD